MPAKRPSGARNETVKCEFCGEDYAITYKHCPFCEEDEPTRIFRRPPAEAPVAPPTRSARRQEDEEDEYDDEPPRRRRARVTEEDEEYEPPRRRTRRDEEDDEPPRRRRQEENYDDDEDDDEYDDSPRRRRGDGGKRLVTNERGGGYRRRGPSPARVIGAVLTLALVAAAVYIVFLIVKPIFGKADPTPKPTTPVVTASPSPSVTPSGEEGNIVVPTDEPGVVIPPVESQTPPPVVTTIPDGQTATGFDLGKTEFTLSDTYPTYLFKVKFTPEGSSGSITWQSSKPNVVSVDANGKVSGVAQGVATITATMAGGYTRECMVRSTIGGAPSAQPSTAPSGSAPVIPSTAPSAAPAPSPSTSGTLSFNLTVPDFTLSGAGDTWTLKVKNATGTPTWAVKNSAIATVDANGKVTAVAKGATTITATVDGQTLECVVRVSG